jgi:hypothetical protein
MGQWNREEFRNIVSAGSMLTSSRGLKYWAHETCCFYMVPSCHGAWTARGLGIGVRGEVKHLRFNFTWSRTMASFFVNDVTNGQNCCYRWFVLAPDPVHGFIWNLHFSLSLTRIWNLFLRREMPLATYSTAVGSSTVVPYSESGLLLQYKVSGKLAEELSFSSHIYTFISNKKCKRWFLILFCHYFGAKESYRRHVIS